MGRNARRAALALALGLFLTRPAFVPHPRTLNAESSNTKDSKVAVASGLQQLDASYNPQWLEVEEQQIGQLDWLHPQTGFAVAATGLYGFDMLRFLGLVKPTATEALIAVFVYLGLYASRLEEVKNMDKHYQVSFYASIGWTIYALASLFHALSCGPEPPMSRDMAESLHTVGAGIFLLSCGYFYSYHWGRIFRHIQEGRFRPYFAFGLASLTFVHGLTVGHIWKMMDDPQWYDTVQKIYPDQWQWIADTRFAELYLTALALFLVILHLRGVLTGTANAKNIHDIRVPLPGTSATDFQVKETGKKKKGDDKNTNWNLQLFKTQEEISAVKKQLKKEEMALGRHEEKDAKTASHFRQKVIAIKAHLSQLHEREKDIQQKLHHKKNHRKLTVF